MVMTKLNTTKKKHFERTRNAISFHLESILNEVKRARHETKKEHTLCNWFYFGAQVENRMKKNTNQWCPQSFSIVFVMIRCWFSSSSSSHFCQCLRHEIEWHIDVKQLHRFFVCVCITVSFRWICHWNIKRKWFSMLFI